MNVDINLIPKELRIKPLIDGKTFAAIIVILLLAFGSVYFYNERSNSEAAITNLQSQINTMQQQTSALSNNPEATKLISSINQLKAAKNGYDAFVASRVALGNAMAGVYSLVPMGVNIASITQKNNTLVIAGSASSYTDVSDYARALNNDSMFSLVSLPSFNEGLFSLIINVAPGGAR
jgi:Tfp pilus assembly protein PilN